MWRVPWHVLQPPRDGPRPVPRDKGQPRRREAGDHKGGKADDGPAGAGHGVVQNKARESQRCPPVPAFTKVTLRIVTPVCNETRPAATKLLHLTSAGGPAVRTA